MLSLPLSLLLCACAVSAGPALTRRLSVHDKRDIPASFVRVGNAAPATMLNMRINLAMGDGDGLANKLAVVSDPSSATFREWLSKEEVEDFARPTAETTAAVNSWLAQHGVQAVPLTPAGDWIGFSLSVATANKMLNAQFSVFQHVASGQESVRTLNYSVPVELTSIIRVIHPTTSFAGPLRAGPAVQAVRAKSRREALPAPAPIAKELAPRATVPTSCSKVITPPCILALYSIPTTAATSKTNSIGIAGFGDQFANKADLTQWLKEFRPDIPSNTSFSLTSVDGGTNSQTRSQAGDEANLDIQYTVGIASGVPATFISVGDTNKDGADEGFLDIINALIAETAPPLVVTTSYGFDVESDLSLSLSTALCNSYMQLTSRGVSITFATGDGGVASTPGVQCNNKPFPPSFPTCPFVTLVGATQGVPEVGAGLSAGGFSNYFATASWQTTAVANYLTLLGTTNSGKFNRTGRAYPDVSAQGNNIDLLVDGSLEESGGTSFSSPIFSAVISLVNDKLIAAGKPVLGFLNPWLYANPQMFNDITSGSNPGCGTQGFPAKAGWDPVTGLGTPNFPAMLTAAGV